MSRSILGSHTAWARAFDELQTVNDSLSDKRSRAAALGDDLDRARTHAATLDGQTEGQESEVLQVRSMVIQELAAAREQRANLEKTSKDNLDAAKLTSIELVHKRCCSYNMAQIRAYLERVFKCSNVVELQEVVWTRDHDSGSGDVSPEAHKHIDAALRTIRAERSQWFAFVFAHYMKQYAVRTYDALDRRDSGKGVYDVEEASMVYGPEWLEYVQTFSVSREPFDDVYLANTSPVFDAASPSSYIAGLRDIMSAKIASAEASGLICTQWDKDRFTAFKDWSEYVNCRNLLASSWTSRNQWMQLYRTRTKHYPEADDVKAVYGKLEQGADVPDVNKFHGCAIERIIQCVSSMNVPSSSMYHFLHTGELDADLLTAMIRRALAAAGSEMDPDSLVGLVGNDTLFDIGRIVATRGDAVQRGRNILATRMNGMSQDDPRVAYIMGQCFSKVDFGEFVDALADSKFNYDELIRAYVRDFGQRFVLAISPRSEAAEVCATYDERATMAQRIIDALAQRSPTGRTGADVKAGIVQFDGFERDSALDDAITAHDSSQSLLDGFVAATMNAMRTVVQVWVTKHPYVDASGDNMIDAFVAMQSGYAFGREEAFRLSRDKVADELVMPWLKTVSPIDVFGQDEIPVENVGIYETVRVFAGELSGNAFLWDGSAGIRTNVRDKLFLDSLTPLENFGRVKEIAASTDSVTYDDFTHRVLSETAVWEPSDLAYLREQLSVGSDTNYRQMLEAVNALARGRGIEHDFASGRVPVVTRSVVEAVELMTMSVLAEGVRFEATKALDDGLDVLRYIKAVQTKEGTGVPDTSTCRTIECIQGKYERIKCLGTVSEEARRREMQHLIGMSTLGSSEADVSAVYGWLFGNDGDRLSECVDLLHQTDIVNIQTKIGLFQVQPDGATMLRWMQADGFKVSGLDARLEEDVMKDLHPIVRRIVKPDTGALPGKRLANADIMSRYIKTLSQEVQPSLATLQGFQTHLRGVMQTDFDKSARKAKTPPPAFECSGDEFEQYWTCLNTMLTYKDDLFPVRIIVNVRTGGYRGGGDAIAEDTFKEMVGSECGGAFKTLKVRHNGTETDDLGPFFKTIKNGMQLESIVESDMAVLTKIAADSTPKYKHYVYSAYGFSGSGKTTTLIHSPVGEQKPVLQLIAESLNKLPRSFSVTLYLNDLYGEIEDDGCGNKSAAVVTGGGENLMKKTPTYQRITAYTASEVLGGITSGHLDLGTDPDVAGISLTDASGLDLNALPSKLSQFTEKAEGDYVSKMRRNFGGVAVDNHRFHIRTTPNNPTSSRAHTFIRLVVRNARGDVKGKVTLIDMAGSEDVDIIQQSYFEDAMIVKARLGQPANLLVKSRKVGADALIVKAWANRFIEQTGENPKNATMQGLVDQLWKDIANVQKSSKFVLRDTGIDIVGQNGAILATPLKNLFKNVLLPRQDEATGELHSEHGFYTKFETWASLWSTYASRIMIDDASAKIYDVPDMWKDVNTVLSVPPGILDFMGQMKALALIVWAWNNLITKDVETVSESNVVDWASTLTKALSNGKWNSADNRTYLENVRQDPGSQFHQIKFKANGQLSGVYETISDKYIDTVPKIKPTGKGAKGVAQKDPVAAELKTDFDVCTSIASVAVELHKAYTKLFAQVTRSAEGLKSTMQKYEDFGAKYLRFLPSVGFKPVEFTKTYLQGKPDQSVLDRIDSVYTSWQTKTVAAEAAMKRVHCPLRYQGNYIMQTLEGDLKHYLESLQESSLPTTQHSPWVNKFLMPPDHDTEDVKFVQFINIRADFEYSAPVDQDPLRKTYAEGALKSLQLGHELNPLRKR